MQRPSARAPPASRANGGNSKKDRNGLARGPCENHLEGLQRFPPYNTKTTTSVTYAILESSLSARLAQGTALD